jgi:hypothetical protein
MSEVDKLNKKRLALAKDLGAIRDKLHEKRVEFGILARTHKSDPTYSAARYSNLEKDINHLREQEAALAWDLEQAELAYTLATIPKPSPEQQAARDKKRAELTRDLAQVRADLSKRRGSLGSDVINGADLDLVMVGISHLEQREAALVAGLVALNG